ncbi:hypothetical protein QEZ54_27180 [Catellatospora sp. KI3]|uniref:hypothetical protein n=1 Tax=Catellatospora sp. KI3 TaxID=3041620 RepID=UPI0024821A74|nr:hypothetical protein [Catellatospora sp. KI3]MDI1464659.1 hypothetical protein [Catellatospora sp. KI3]
MLHKGSLIRRALLGLTAAAAATVLVASPAAAAIDDSFSAGTSDGCAVINFVDSGYYPPTGSNNDDFFVIHDYCSDGKGVTGFAALNNGTPRSTHNGNGLNGAPVYWDPFGNIVGGDLIAIYACATRNKVCVDLSELAQRYSRDG